MGELREINSTGDTKVIWDPKNKDEVDAARCQFNTLKSKGFTAYSVGDDHEKNKVIKEFDEKAGRIIMVPKMTGG